MVTGMVGNHHSCKTTALGKPGSHSKHDAVTERHNRRLHVLIVITSLRYSIRPFEKRAAEMARHEGQIYLDPFYAKPLAIKARIVGLPPVMV